MPLIHDPDWQSELDKIQTKVARTNVIAWWGRLIFNTIILGGALWLLIYLEAPEGTMISAMVAVATLCIVATANAAADALHETLAILVSTVEWTGRKQLGEYEKPEA